MSPKVNDETLATAKAAAGKRPRSASLASNGSASKRVKPDDASTPNGKSPKKKSKSKQAKPAPPTSSLGNSNFKRLLEAKAIKQTAPGGRPKPRAKPVGAAESSATPAVSNEQAIFALDCEMVGVGPGKVSSLARVAVVDATGAVVLNEYVRPTEFVTDFRTKWSGILPHHLRDGTHPDVMREKIKKLLAQHPQHLVVGHDLQHDLKALQLELPEHCLRDTARYRPYTAVNASTGKRATRSLKALALEFLGRVIQEGHKGHDPIEDARTSLALYLKEAPKWEARLKTRKST